MISQRHQEQQREDRVWGCARMVARGGRSVSVLMETSNCALGRRLAVRVWTRLQRYSGR